MGKPQKPWHDAAKGYRYSDDRVAYKGVDYMAKTDDREEIDAIALQSLNQFVEICQNADIQVLFVEMPSANSWNRPDIRQWRITHLIAIFLLLILI